MRTEFDNPIRYFFRISNQEIPINELIGQKVSIQFTGQINCINCGRKTNKSFAQGYCYPCFIKSPETEECVLRPELCRAHEGVARDMEYAANHCLIDHFVYLSFTSNTKVGVTRHTQIPTRWIDQGALSAIKIAKTPNRYIAGLIEVTLKAQFSDKTNWRNMLKNSTDTSSLLLDKEKALNFLSKGLNQYSITENELYSLYYPTKLIPEKITSFSFDKIPHLSDILVGIKGQYLIFANGNVLNVRNYSGYQIELEF